jgi:predicted 2-oxoglutarate/Fe(II)-dependent dioxygenase YbiX
VTPAQDVDLIDLAWSLDTDGHTTKAFAALDLALSSESNVADALELKGHLLRSRGELRPAAKVFDELARRDPEHSYARYLSDLLSDAHPSLPAARPAPWPAPYVRLENFLDRARHNEVMALLASRATAFEPSTVGVMGANGREPRVDLNSRLSFRLTEVGPIAHWLLPLIKEPLRTIGALLGIAPFAMGQIELKCTAYGDGNFFSVHSDSVYHPTRRISFVYYFHRSPKPYSGGALLLYDGDVENAGRYFPDRVTRLETLDNSIVFFPSSAYHEVARVVSNSGHFEDARFTFAGHVHALGDNAPVNAPPS